jgi:hypothetical protein
MQTSSEILNRIIRLKDLPTDAKLAELWNIPAVTLSSWRTRNSIPYEKVITFCREEGLSLEFVFWGEGSKQSTTLNSLEEKLIQALRAISAERREAIYHTVIGQLTLALAEKKIKADQAKRKVLLDAIQETAAAIGAA